MLVEALYSSWNWSFWTVLALGLSAWTYYRGWRLLHQHVPRHFSYWRLASFLTGLLLLLIAIASPLDAFSGMLLTVHMIQHLLLMMIVPPLILLGSPFLPILRGLPRRFLKEGLGPFLSWPLLQKLGHFLTHPLFCLLAFTLTTLLWHLPVLYELALRSQFWHEVEHTCFLSTAVLFWWPVIQPWPTRARWPRWAMIPYMLVADLQNTALSAFLIFYERVLYPTYAAAPRLFGMSALEDQAAAGSIMWVPGSLSFLMPVGLITMQLLSSRRAAVRPSSVRVSERQIQPQEISIAGSHSSLDLLSVPVLGSLFRWRYFRRVLQVLMFGLALLVIVDGFLGPQMSPMNLAGVLPWIHWRGLLVIVLLVAGNFFCMACPFMLTRELGRFIFPARWRWPAALRSKWLAVGLLALYLWAYEAFRLWDSPAWTAWILIGYFVAAFLVDGFFKGASFCKYMCPIGQYNFVQSLVSPLEVKIRNIDACRSCRTYDCIRGNEYERGCELHLFQPRKSGNFDCTFCMDCVHACPHQNVGIIAVVPAHDLILDRHRSSVGRFSKRADIATLVGLLVFGAFVNAAGMIAPFSAWAEFVRVSISSDSMVPVVTVIFATALLLGPAILVSLCGAFSRLFGGIQVAWKEVTCGFVMAFIPLGFSMWIAHYSYHFASGVQSIHPVLQRVLVDLGMHTFGNPNWTMPSLAWMDSLPSSQILLLDLGLLLTLYIAWQVSCRFTNRTGSAFRVLIPWAGLAVLLYIVGVWIVLQPMEMRGMMIH